MQAVRLSGWRCVQRSSGCCVAHCRWHLLPAAECIRAEPLASEQFIWAVEASKESITRGDVYQLVLSVQFTGTHSISPFEAYRALRLLNPSPYMFFVDLGDIQVAGSSPEALVKLRRGHASLRPIAVRARAGVTPEQDVAHEQSLLATRTPSM